MSAAPKRSPAAAWRALGKMAEDDASDRHLWERISTLSPAALDRELVEAGIDPADARARGERFNREAARLAAEARRPPRRSPTRTLSLLLAAAVALLLIAGLSGGPAIVARWVHPEQEIGPDRLPNKPLPAPDPLLAQHARAIKLRTDAHADCNIALWRDCLRQLDEARALDPGGEDDPRVQRDRERAARGLAESDIPSK
jgi:hypothetical protein